MARIRLPITVATISVCLLAGLVCADGERELAGHLMTKAGVSRGFCVVFGSGGGELPLALARQSTFFIHAGEPSAQAVRDARTFLDAEGVYGRRVVVDRMDFKHLPYVDNMVDLVLALVGPGAGLDAYSVTEILRVLRPGGTAIVGCTRGSDTTITPQAWGTWADVPGEALFGSDGFGTWGEITKPTPPGTDVWSHWEHGPDNNPVSSDAVIRAPYLTQWIAGPLYTSMPGITTAAGGRIFTALGHIAHHKREERWLNTILARNGYNGMELWTRKLPDGYLVHRSAFIATEDVFYMIDGDGCLMLDTETGRVIDQIRIPEIDGEWKYMALKDGVMYVLAGTEKDPAETTVVRSSYTHWSWGELSHGYYTRRIPWGFGRTVAAYDVKRKKLLWEYTGEHAVDSRSLVLGGGKMFFYCPGAHTGCIDAVSGQVIWTNSDSEVVRLIEEPGRGLVSTPGFKTTCYALYSPEVIFYQAQTRMNVVAISSRDGNLLWTRKKTSNNPNMLFVEKKLIVGIGPRGSTLVLDPMTGETLKDLGFAKRSCARLTATPDSFFCRGMPEGLTRYDRNAQKVLYNGAFRPACNDGVIPANGLLYLGPWLCDCNLSLMGTNALCSAGDFDVQAEDPVSERLHHAAKSSEIAPFPEVTAADWPTYRGDNNRTASSPVAVSPTAKLVWTYEPKQAYRPTAPTACGNLVFMGGDDGKVRAIDAATGSLVWSYLTSAPVLAPPTIWRGRVYVGSSDGSVYTLEAATGRLLWRFRAAPVERRIMVFGRLWSTWPVMSGVLVADGVAYAVAGIIDFDGTHVCALDAVTGEPRWRNTTSGHLDEALRKGVSAQGTLTVAQGRLWMPGGNVISPGIYDLKDGQCLSRDVGNGSPRANRGEEIGVLGDKYLIFGGRLKFSAVRNVVNPGTFAISKLTGGRLGASTILCIGKIPPAWSTDVIVTANGPHTVPACVDVAAIEGYVEEAAKLPPRRRMRQLHALKKRWTARDLQGNDTLAFAVTANAVLVVLEAPGHRSRFPQWSLAGLDLTTGTVAKAGRLPGAPLPGGLAVTRHGRVLVPLEDGRVVCFQ